MKRPAVLLCLSYTLGIVMKLYFKPLFIVIFLFLMIIVICYKMKKDYAKYFLIAIFLAIISFMQLSYILNTIDKINKQIVYEDSVTLTCLIEKIEEQDQGLKLTGRVLSYSGKTIQNMNAIKTLLYSKQFSAVQVGDLIQIKGQVKEITKPKNPGGFDSYSYYYARKIYFITFVNEMKLIKPKANQLDSIRNTILKTLTKQMNKIYIGETAAIMNTMLFGNNQNLDTLTKEYYKISGISHILAISGMHVTMFGMGLFWFLKNIIKKERIGVILSCLILWGYCILSGACISSVRATIMFTLLVFSYFFGEKYDIYTALFVSALLILILNPFQLIDIGFLLSFFAVLGIVAVTPVLNERFNRKNHKFIELVTVTLGASITTTPVLLYYFYQLPLYALIVNIIVVPTSSLLLGFGVAGILFSFVHIFLGRFFSAIVYFVLKFIEMCGLTIMQLPLNMVTIGKPSLIVIMLYSVVLMVYLYTDISRIKKIVVYISMGILSLILFLTDYLNSKEVTINFLSVGQGDCAVVEYRNKVYMIDGGGEINKTGEVNVGNFVVMPYLKSKGITHLDGIFISHSDFDHIYGIIEVIKVMPTDFIVLSKAYEEYEDDLVRELLIIAKEKHIPVYYFETTDKYEYRGLVIECIYPKDVEVFYANNNARTMVLSLNYKDMNVLFFGDLEANQEEQLIQQTNMIQSEVIKVPHHGSDTSSTESLLNAILPEIAIFSYGIPNSFGHPSSQVVKRYQDLSADIYETAKDGAVILKTDGKTYQVRTYYSLREENYHCKR